MYVLEFTLRQRKGTLSVKSRSLAFLLDALKGDSRLLSCHVG
jgi:hypothetical protein